MFQKIIDFFIRKKVEGATEGLTKVSKTKVFMTIEAILMAVEFASQYFGYAVVIPDNIHKLLYTLAGIAYAERALKG
jgi:hypothetical protein